MYILFEKCIYILALANCISNFCSLLLWLLFQLYEELFEIPFFESSAEFYKAEAQRLREGSDCVTFMWRVSFILSATCTA